MTFSRFVLHPRFRVTCNSKKAFKVTATTFAAVLVTVVVLPNVCSAQIPATPPQAEVLSLSFVQGNRLSAGCMTTVQNSPWAKGWIRKHQGIGELHVVSGPEIESNPTANTEFSLVFDPPEVGGWEVDKPHSIRLEVKNSQESPIHFEGVVHFIIRQGENGLEVEYIQQGGGEG